MFAFTDEELRSGDPSDTIRRASMMPGQLQDSLSSHRLSVMMANCGTAGRRSDRLSLMPGPLPARNTSLTQLRSSKDTKRPSSSVAAVLASSPEVTRIDPGSLAAMVNHLKTVTVSQNLTFQNCLASEILFSPVILVPFANKHAR